jgi:putative transposase
MKDSTAVTLKAELVDELCKSLKNPQDLFGPEGLFHQLKAALMERMLDAEMSEHLGYDKNAPEGHHTGNSRNGYTSKTVKTDTGPVEIRIPRDRAGTFEPQLVPKHRRRLPGFDDKVLSLYARGMSTRDIRGHLRELYGTDVDADLISAVTDAVMDEARAWQSRPLDALYPIVYIDALFVSMRDGGVVTKKAVYVALGTTLEGRREVLGLWIQATEGARFWLGVLTELKQRGVKDVFFVCCDGLSGLPQAIEAAFPKATVQTCIVHMIRASMRYVPEKERKLVARDLRPIYAADTEATAATALGDFEQRWAKYPSIARLWRSRWIEVVPFLEYPQAIRRILYTTNAIESLNSQLRKVLRNKGHFPTDDAVLKLLFLAINNAQVKWKPAPEWPAALAHFAIIFADRMPA